LRGQLSSSLSILTPLTCTRALRSISVHLVVVVAQTVIASSSETRRQLLPLATTPSSTLTDLTSLATEIPVGVHQKPRSSQALILAFQLPSLEHHSALNLSLIPYLQSYHTVTQVSVSALDRSLNVLSHNPINARLRKRERRLDCTVVVSVSSAR
jgi:hypothetical protein